nr:hypothetical protein [Vibrio crassostreae]
MRLVFTVVCGNFGTALLTP